MGTQNDFSIRWGFKKAYTNAGLTLEELGARTQICRSYLSLFSTGRVNLTADELARVSNELGVPSSQITG